MRVLDTPTARGRSTLPSDVGWSIGAPTKYDVAPSILGLVTVTPFGWPRNAPGVGVVNGVSHRTTRLFSVSATQSALCANVTPNGRLRPAATVTKGPFPRLARTSVKFG